MIYIDRTSKKPLYEQIYECVKTEILSEKLTAGSTLPPIRTLASELSVSKSTVETAYTQLIAEGYIHSLVGSGYTVENIRMYSKLYHSSGRTSPSSQKKKAAATVPEKEEIPVRYDFQYGNIPLSSFPAKQWKKQLNNLFLDEISLNMTAFSSKSGNEDLRKELQAYLYSSRGVNCEKEQILITSGLQDSLALICDILPKKNQVIGFEEPGYVRARKVFEQRKFPVYPIDVFGDAYRKEQLDDFGVKTLFLTPSHQFPTGGVMPISKRYEMLSWATDSDGYLIENDYDSELRYHTNPIPSLQSLDIAGRVIYIGTFSRSLSPAIRINYMILPEELLADYEEMFDGFYSKASYLDQMVLAGLMHDGTFEKHVRKICKENEKRHDYMVAILKKTFGDEITIHGMNAGLHMLVQFHNAQKCTRLYREARESGVIIYPIDECYIKRENNPSDCFLFGFSRLSFEEIYDGITILGEIYRKL